MKKILFLSLILVFFSCIPETKTDLASFRTGKFKTILEDNDMVSHAIRNDTMQIETYNSKRDTFYIEWINNFEYVLLKKDPKTKLDSTPFHVKLTALKEKSYNFSAYYKGSKFKQKGRAIKIE